MRVFMDDDILTVERPTLEAVLVAARDESKKRGRVLLDVSLDGHVLDEALIENLVGEVMEDAEIRFRSVDPVALVVSSLREASDALTDAKTRQETVASLLQLGEQEKAIEELAVALRCWEATHQAVVHGATLLGMDLTTLRLPCDGETVLVLDKVDSLAAQLLDIKQAMEVEDWTQVADVLGFEMQTHADVWHTLLVALADKLERDGGVV